MKKKLLRVFYVICHPVEDVAFCLKALGMVKCCRKARIVVGVFVMALGSTIASSAPHDLPFLGHIIIDLIGYGIHGLGAAPIIRVIAEVTGVDI